MHKIGVNPENRKAIHPPSAGPNIQVQTTRTLASPHGCGCPRGAYSLSLDCPSQTNHFVKRIHGAVDFPCPHGKTVFRTIRTCSNELSQEHENRQTAGLRFYRHSYPLHVHYRARHLAAPNRRHHHPPPAGIAPGQGAPDCRLVRLPQQRHRSNHGHRQKLGSGTSRIFCRRRKKGR